MVLHYEEFLEVQEQFQDYEDLRCLREAKAAEEDAPTIGIEEVRKKLRVRTCLKDSGSGTLTEGSDPASEYDCTINIKTRGVIWNG